MQLLQGVPVQQVLVDGGLGCIAGIHHRLQAATHNEPYGKLQTLHTWVRPDSYKLERAHLKELGTAWWGMQNCRKG